MQVITSKDNEIVKKIRKLKEKKYRDEENVYVIEGIKVIEEAIKENVNIGTRETYADIGATILDILQMPLLSTGKSFKNEIIK